MYGKTISGTYLFKLKKRKKKTEKIVREGIIYPENSERGHMPLSLRSRRHGVEIFINLLTPDLINLNI